MTWFLTIWVFPFSPEDGSKVCGEKPIATLLRHGTKYLSIDPADRAAWTEADRDAFEEWGLGNEAPIPVKYIFGKSGRRPDKGGARLYVANAELQNAASLKEWLRYLQHPRGSSSWELQPEDVLQYFATVRAQTAMDRETGAAREDTLRLTRTLQPGLVFHAPVKFLKPPNEALFNALVLGASALKYMGVSRTRGLGKVRCRLINNLTEQVLSGASFPKITVARPSPSKQKPIQQSTDHLLRYRLTLKDPIVISGAGGDPNTVVTRRDIPGSHVWGAAAWHYLQQKNHDSTDPAFKQAFLNGKLRFLAAYPEACDNEPGQRLIPIPHALRQFKEDERLVDLLKKNARGLKKPTHKTY